MPQKLSKTRSVSERRGVWMDPFGEFSQHEIRNARETNEELGEGSYGVVKVYEREGKPCAGKTIYEELLSRGDILRCYRDECRLMAKLKHSNIVEFIGVIRRRPPVLLMERLPIDLDKLLENTEKIPIGLRVSFLIDISKGLVYLHSQESPIIHRDLSARNVLLSTSLVAKISDLGNARIVNFSPSEVARLSKNPGTPVYMPPEVLESAPLYGPSLDVFSFGVVALFTATQVSFVCVCMHVESAKATPNQRHAGGLAITIIHYY